MTVHSLLRWLLPAGAGLVLLATATYAQRPLTPTMGTARIWFYRDMAPYSSLATPYVRLNGVVAGVSQPGGASYRDVPAGHRVAVYPRGPPFSTLPICGMLRRHEIRDLLRAPASPTVDGT